MTTSHRGLSPDEHAEMRARLMAGSQRLRPAVPARVWGTGLALVIVGGLVGSAVTALALTHGAAPEPATTPAPSDAHYAVSQPLAVSPYEYDSNYGTDPLEFEPVLDMRILETDFQGQQCLSVWVDYVISPGRRQKDCVDPGSDPVVDVVLVAAPTSPWAEDYVPTSAPGLAAFPVGTTLRYTLADGVVTVDVIPPAPSASPSP